jgi:hypothetical protein
MQTLGQVERPARNQIDMAYYIPFVNSKGDWSLAREFYPDSAVYRVTMESRQEIGWPSSTKSKLWVDTGVDGLHNWPSSGDEKFGIYISRFAGAKKIADAAFWMKPDRKAVANFVNQILDNVAENIPSVEWLSVPQLPHVDGTERNKINRCLAEATHQWRTKTEFPGKLILPVIFTHQRQLNNKTERKGKVSLVASCFESSGADGLWVVDSSLGDQEGTGNFAHRFQGIVRLHEELNRKLSTRAISIAGPYWGLNLVLWARGLAQYAGIGVGRGYRYYIPGSVRTRQANVRVALSPLRRQALCSPELKTWIKQILPKISKGDPTHAQFLGLLNEFDILKDRNSSRRQVAQFYKGWLKKFEGIPTDGRPLALYQDFSSAYVLGKTLDDIPDPENLKSPSRLAEQFMMTCL